MHFRPDFRQLAPQRQGDTAVGVRDIEVTILTVGFIVAHVFVYMIH